MLPNKELRKRLKAVGGNAAKLLLKINREQRKKMTWESRVRANAESVLKLTQDVYDLRARGEDDPVTDLFKAKLFGLEIAWNNYHEFVRPKEILELLDEVESLRDAMV